MQPLLTLPRSERMIHRHFCRSFLLAVIAATCGCVQRTSAAQLRHAPQPEHALTTNSVKVLNVTHVLTTRAAQAADDKHNYSSSAVNATSNQSRLDVNASASSSRVEIVTENTTRSMNDTLLRVQPNMGAPAGSVVAVNTEHTQNLTYPFQARVEPAVGKVWALYFNSYTKAKASSVEATDKYVPADRGPAVWDGDMMLPEPGCSLKIRSLTNYPTARRKANYRKAEIAICEVLQMHGTELPKCSASDEQVCELTLSIPMPSSDEMQEPYIAGAMALAAYSKICALGRSSSYNSYKCKIHRSETAISAGMTVQGGEVALTGMSSPGLIDLKLDDAYILSFRWVYMSTSSRDTYYQTRFYHTPDHHFNHQPPEVQFCGNLQCLVSSMMGPH